ncbi:ParB/RepB/Spo0J family partition protein [Methylorubrum rhodesianum]|jgi:ParB family transcriptional regulator, chromosome partitioning protein|uniref:ParB/RepB/Spo0J family partition protein n=1 Tax=Methylobacteriaceae TaxID=119045 RepID=UPI001F12BA8F|nr:ParB/RepB/Spo0J family partition protein [Methylobacterium organophilum]UMY20315.1 ParB/RepB/Spo0J family partition protein [Methylobacterium organophilum]
MTSTITAIDARPETRIALDRLSPDPLNVRKTYRPEAIAELAASIKAVGLLKNLVVRKAKKRGHFYVSAGGRRLAALNMLAEAGDLTADYAVRAIECSAAEAVEISLAENVTAEAMNPVDEFEAYNALVSDRVPVAEIAARFGKTDAYIRQRMALARVSPRILDAYRVGEIDFDIVAAFTVSDDHARQDEVWATLSTWNRHALTIKRLLAGNAISATDRRVAFVGGLAAYEAAGGPVRRDLFDATPNAGYALDEAFLERLVADRLEAQAEPVRGEGWAWVEVRPSIEWQDLRAFQHIDPQPVDLSDEQSAALDALQAERSELETVLDVEGDDEAGTGEARIEAIDAQVAALSESRFTPADMATGGAIVAMDYYGRIVIHRGLRRPEAGIRSDQEAGTVPAGAATDVQDRDALPGSDAVPASASITHSAAFLTDLTAQKTAALRIELAHNPDVALVAVVHAMLLNLIYPYAIVKTALELRLVNTRLEPAMKNPDGNAALADLASMAENYGHALPGDPADLWEHLSRLSREELLNLLAFAAAHGVNAVQQPHDQRVEAREQANQLGQSLAVDMGRWFTPTGASYFQHLNRAGIEAAVIEAKGADAALKVRAAAKKSEAVNLAERLVAGSGWLPEPVRVPAPEANQGDDSVPYRMAAE